MDVKMVKKMIKYLKMQRSSNPALRAKATLKLEDLECMRIINTLDFYIKTLKDQKEILIYRVFAAQNIREVVFHIRKTRMLYAEKERRTKKAHDALTEALKDDELHVRRAAFKALLDIKDPTALSAPSRRFIVTGFLVVGGSLMVRVEALKDEDIDLGKMAVTLRGLIRAERKKEEDAELPGKTIAIGQEQKPRLTGGNTHPPPLGYEGPNPGHAFRRNGRINTLFNSHFNKAVGNANKIRLNVL